jgi:hypothetical protein
MCFLEDLSVGDFRMAMGCGLDGESLAFGLAGPTTFHGVSSESLWVGLLRVGVVGSGVGLSGVVVILLCCSVTGIISVVSLASRALVKLLSSLCHAVANLSSRWAFVLLEAFAGEVEVGRPLGARCSWGGLFGS